MMNTIIRQFENKDFQLIQGINKAGRKFKALVILYGPSNYGKTRILKNLINRLTGGSLKQKGDVRCVFWANNHTFCVCTGGDNRMVVEMNCAAFDITASNTASPLICITAARIGHGSSSIADVLDYYSRKIREDCYITIWINIKELLSTAARLTDVMGYDSSNDLKLQLISSKSINSITDKACELLENQIQMIEKL